MLFLGKDMEINEEKLNFYNKVIENEFYKNDKEFLEIIRKLTTQSASLNEKAVSLVNILNEAERIKLEMVQKEIDLGLSQESKPYGEKTLKNVQNDTFVYENYYRNAQEEIENFIHILENYFEVEDDMEKKEMLISAQMIIKKFKEYGLNPLHFIVNKKRSKVWYILEHSYEKTLKKLNHDFFIDKIRTTRLQYTLEVDMINEYHTRKQEAIFTLAQIRKRNGNNLENLNTQTKEKIEKLQSIFKEELSEDIAPLLVDTKKIMDSIDFMLEEIPEELEEDQLKELEQFLPVLAEYFTDQTYALSGGNAFTTLSKHLESLQKLIDKGASAKEILDEIHTLNYTMQHLYILHWIGESLLKEILSCFNFKCSMGMTINYYNREYPNTKTELEKIRQAVFFRNDIAHKGVLWNPESLKQSIDNYRQYIDTIAQERNFSMNDFQPSKLDKKLTQEQIVSRTETFIEKELNSTTQYITKELRDKIEQILIESNWQVSIGRKQQLKKEVRRDINEYTAQKHFNLSYKELKVHLFAYAKKYPDRVNRHDEETLEHAAVKSFNFFVKVQDDPAKKEDSDKNLSLLKRRIEAVSDIKFEKSSLGIKSKIRGYFK